MRLVTKLLICLALVSGTAVGQEGMRQFMAGPSGDQTRVVLVLAGQLADGYKMQSMIIDLTPIKTASEQPASIQVDLTSTVRNLVNGAKDQKVFIIRWSKSGEIELKCDGKWKKHDTNAAIEKVIAVTSLVIQNIPLDANKPTELTMSPEIEEAVVSIMEAMKGENLPCLRKSH